MFFQARQITKITVISNAGEIRSSLPKNDKHINVVFGGIFSYWENIPNYIKSTIYNTDERIHFYHQQTARNLYNMYSGNDEFTKIVFALKTGTLSKDALDSDLLPLFENIGEVSVSES